MIPIIIFCDFFLTYFLYRKVRYSKKKDTRIEAALYLYMLTVYNFAFLYSWLYSLGWFR